MSSTDEDKGKTSQEYRLLEWYVETITTFGFDLLGLLLMEFIVCCEVY